MNEVKADVYKSLKKNHLIVWLTVISCIIISCFSIWTAREARMEADRYLYGISNEGKLIPLERMERKDADQIFKQSHVELFMNNFYDYDQWNYEKKVERALWLIDAEIGKRLYYDYKENKGHYNKMIQSSSSQSVSNVDVKIDANDNFILSAFIEINKINQDKPRRYLFKAKGTLARVSQNYPLNPYGFLITNFVEISNTQINE